MTHCLVLWVLHSVHIGVPRISHLLHMLILDHWNTRWCELCARLESRLWLLELSIMVPLLNLGHVGLGYLETSRVKILLHLLLLLGIVVVSCHV